MREVGGEHDAVDADMLTLLDRDALVLHAEIDVVSHIVARQFLERLEAEIFLRPAEMALIPQIHMLEPERDPAEAGLGKEDLQLWMALEDAGQHQLRDADRRRQAEIAQPFKKRPAQSLHDYGVFLRIAEGRLGGARAGAVELDMHGDRHLHVDRGGPELVVLGGRIALGAGEGTHQDAFEAELLAMRHLGDRVVDIGDRDDAHADQAVGRDSAIFLGEPVVVAADHRLIDLVMADVAPEDGTRDHRREQHLGVHAVTVLLLDALLGRAGAGGIGDLEAEGLPRPLSAASAQVEEIRLQ